MSTLRVTAEVLTVHEHPNADALGLAQVGLYRAVVARGAFRSGEVAVRIPEQAVLPDELTEELGLTGRLAGAAANRVGAVRLRGELSQGIVCRPKALDGVGEVLSLASGRETVSGRGLHLREGAVIRPATERYSPVTGGRAIAKAVSPACLTRKGGTEYE
ncbi:hypothetical protein Shyhy01_65090 [Streptomyces hygroscopicus subsp. hygroscopicus]|nr:hypothetical protein [Streptomyces hygroscopicus]GLX53559.1 hypothetical protein Shyhy01_65090 [Streptomyces hygroscopicus subsp. hygroscopicus]